MYILLITTQFLFFLLQFPFIQNVLTGQAETFLNAKLKTRVEIGEINFALPHYLVVKDVLILDYQQDTLWASQELRADLFFEELLKSNVVIDNLILQKATAKIYQQEDGYFNYEPLLAALTDTTSTSTIEEKPNKPWGFAIKKVILGDVNFEYKK